MEFQGLVLGSIYFTGSEVFVFEFQIIDTPRGNLGDSIKISVFLKFSI
jgi:hypothetical protein